MLTNLRLEFVPVAETNLRDRAQQESILLFGEGLELVRSVRKLQLAPRVLVHGDLFAHSLQHVVLALNLLFTLFDVADDALVIGNLGVTLPEDGGVILDLLQTQQTRSRRVRAFR